MEKTSIKGVSVSELESAFAEVLNRLTNGEWSVNIGSLSYPKGDGVEAVLFGSRERLRLDLEAQEIVPSVLDSL